jgi:hypothetical protein
LLEAPTQTPTTYTYPQEMVDESRAQGVTDGTTTIPDEIRKLNLAYQRVDQRHQYHKDDMVYTRGLSNPEHDSLHCMITGPMKENGLYPVHTILRNGTSRILLIGPENMILSTAATSRHHLK